MRRFALALLAAALAPVSALAAGLSVPLNEAVRVTLPTQAHDVIVGNPAIADVTVADAHHLVLTGKTDGVTNVIVTDVRGRTIFDRQIVVSAGDLEGVTLINGPTVSTYACAATCRSQGGDAASDMGNFLGAMSSMVKSIGSQASAAGQSAPASVGPGAGAP